MRPRHTVLLLAVTAALAGCARTHDVGNLDSDGLIAAIRAANENPGVDVIRLAPKGLYTLRYAPRDATTWLPPITDDLRIEGNGAEIRRYVDGRRVLLEVARGADVQVRDLALSEGSDGAIRNFGTLRLTSVKVTDSVGAGTPDGATAIVLNHGTLEARDSEIAYNMLPASARDAGTVVNYGTLRLRDTAIHDNTAQRRNASVAVAGAVLNLGRMEATHARIEANEAVDADDAEGALAFPAVLNLGNGHVEGLPREQVREAGMDAAMAVAQR
jgi:hypothetical protein